MKYTLALPVQDISYMLLTHSQGYLISFRLPCNWDILIVDYFWFILFKSSKLPCNVACELCNGLWKWVCSYLKVLFINKILEIKNQCIVEIRTMNSALFFHTRPCDIYFTYVLKTSCFTITHHDFIVKSKILELFFMHYIFLLIDVNSTVYVKTGLNQFY